MRGRRIVGLLTLLALLAMAPACMRCCVPLGPNGTRDLVDLCCQEEHAPVSSGAVREVAAEFRRRTAACLPPGGRPYHFLALSGGGLHGAFGVGVLTGLTESGTRPTYDVVTGISTGALMSTFAFLGPEYDGWLRANLVGIERSQILRLRSPPGMLLFGSVYSPRPLARRIRQEITPEILAKVAQAHAEGRRLYVGTTSLDTRQLILWDMGAIASRGTPESLTLYHDIILASSSVPGAMPPVRFAVEVDGKKYDELHVDGGATDQVIFRGFMVADLNRRTGLPGSVAPAGSTLHIVVNGKLYADPSCVRRGIVDPLATSLESVIYGKARDELHRIYLSCLKTGVDFRLTAVPQKLRVAPGALSLSAADQRLLYEEGHCIGRATVAGEGWCDLPPDSDPEEQSLPRSGIRFATE